MRWRTTYLRAFMRQDMGWYDTNKPEELSGIISTSMMLLEDGLSAKTWVFLDYFGRLVSSVAIAFSSQWDVALVALTTTPIMFFVFTRMLKAYMQAQRQITHAKAAAGGVAVETLSSIRTVASFGMEERCAARYDMHLDHSMDVGMRRVRGMSFKKAMFVNTPFIQQALTSIYIGLSVASEVSRTSAPFAAHAANGQLYAYCSSTCLYDLQDLALISPANVTGGDSCTSAGYTPFEMTCASSATLSSLDGGTAGSLHPSFPRSLAAMQTAMAELGSYAPCHLEAGSAYSAMMTITMVRKLTHPQAQLNPA